MLLEEDLSTQPPIRKEEVAPTSAVLIAMARSRRRDWRVDIAVSPLAFEIERSLFDFTHARPNATAESATRKLNVR